MITIILTLFGVYAGSVVFGLFAGFILDDSNWKYAKEKYIFQVPLIPFYLLLDLINFTNSYLTQNNLKQMNWKVLGKAMGFMFLPTLGVLLMLLVGFFDPIMMWTWIKSPSSWAIFTRIVIFLLEITLVTLLYFHYLKEDVRTQAGKIPGSESRKIRFDTSIYRLFPEGNSDDEFERISTATPEIVIIERTKKATV